MKPEELCVQLEQALTTRLGWQKNRISVKLAGSSSVCMLHGVQLDYDANDDADLLQMLFPLVLEHELRQLQLPWYIIGEIADDPICKIDAFSSECISCLVTSGQEYTTPLP